MTADHKTEDQLLVASVLKGDPAACQSLIKNTEGLVAQILYKLVKKEEDRKDLAQDVYLKVFHQLGGFRFGSKLSTWIAQIAYNTAINYLQKKKFVLLPGESEGDEPMIEQVSNALNRERAGFAERVLEEQDRSHILKEAIAALPVLYQTLITLFHQEELSYAEISKITSLPEGTVKSYLFRARKSLRAIILKVYKRDDL